MKFTATFPSVTTTTTMPLLAVGLPGFTDTLYASVRADHRVEFFFDHHPFGGPRSQPILLQPGKVHTLEVDLGAFYPPAHDTYFAGYDSRARDHLKSLASLRVDATPVITESMRAYDAPPWTLSLGDHPAPLGPQASRFSGRLEGPVRLPNPYSQHFQPPLPHDGIWSLDVEFGIPAIGTNQPLLASGISGAGNLLFARVLDAHTIRLGLDIWGYGAPLSPPIELATPGRHRFDVVVGALAIVYPWPAPPLALQKYARHILVWVDGSPAWIIPVTQHENSYRHVKIGVNHQGFDSALSIFTGEIAVVPQTATEKRAVLERLESLPNP